ncbi:MAG TPA: DHA2 family efflux MFS transporter permease subunit [Bryocella sp.]|nr:DHA2 family efflux MFS transporter permease subunit [Bryocella sp.]
MSGSSSYVISRQQSAFSSRDATGVNPWIVTIAVMLATFMEVLDTTVVNVAVPHMAGNLGATVNEGTWVVTSYLVSNAIVLPMAGWLATRFGRRRMLMLCVAGFTLTSVLCGMATSLEALIFFRVLQGLSGGGLQPLSQSVLLETFPPKKHGTAMAAFGLGIIIAPILGPTLGGWITDNYTWRWIFYINLPVGILSLLMISKFVIDPHYLRKRRHGGVDLCGIGFLALGFGMLQIVLDKGQEKDWFGSNQIRWGTALCVIGLVGMVIRELTAKDPIIDLRVLKDRTFAAGTLLMTMLGFVLYASLMLLPIYLQTLLDYPAFQSGLALSPRGIGALIMTPISGYLTNRLDPRKLLLIGVFTGGFSMLSFSHLNLNAGYWDIFWPQIFQGAAMAFLFTPLMATSMAGITKETMGNATSIYNLMRNIGGSFGIAAMTTLLARRQQVHQNQLISHIAPSDIRTQTMFHGLQAWFSQHQSLSAYDAAHKSWGAIYLMVQQQAAMLSFVEAFWVMAMIFWAMAPLLLLLRNARDLHPHKEPVARPRPAITRKQEVAEVEDLEPELELAGAGSRH